MLLSYLFYTTLLRKDFLNKYLYATEKRIVNLITINSNVILKQNTILENNLPEIILIWECFFSSSCILSLFEKVKLNYFTSVNNYKLLIKINNWLVYHFFFNLYFIIFHGMGGNYKTAKIKYSAFLFLEFTERNFLMPGFFKKNLIKNNNKNVVFPVINSVSLKILSYKLLFLHDFLESLNVKLLKNSLNIKFVNFNFVTIFPYYLRDIEFSCVFSFLFSNSDFFQSYNYLSYFKLSQICFSIEQANIDLLDIVE